MKKLINFIIILVVILCLTSPTFAIRGVNFSHISPQRPWDYAKNDPKVIESYNKAVSLATQYNAVIDQINALDIQVTFINGKVVNTNPYTVQYKPSTSEYVKVGNDYINVTTYYHAIVDNPINRVNLNGTYSGYHIATSQWQEGNIQYLRCGSAGNTFYNLINQKDAINKQYNTAVGDFSSNEKNYLTESIKALKTLYAETTPYFAEYLNSTKYDVKSGSADDPCSPVVFKIGCPAYMTYDKSIRPVEIIDSYPNLNAVPVVLNGVTMVPIRPLIDGFTKESSTISFDKATKAIDIKVNSGANSPICMRGYEIQLTIGSPFAILNGKYYEMPQSAQIINGKTMIPLRAVGEMLNCDVEWIQNDQLIVITPMDASKYAIISDPFWSNITEVEVQGAGTYYHISEDTDFRYASYNFPKDYTLQRNPYYENEREFLDSRDYRSILMSDISNNKENINLTPKEFCKLHDCYLPNELPNIAITKSGDRSEWVQMYYLIMDEGVIIGVIEVYLRGLSNCKVESGEDFDSDHYYYPELDLSKLDPDQYVFLKSLYFPGAVG